MIPSLILLHKKMDCLENKFYKLLCVLAVTLLSAVVVAIIFQVIYRNIIIKIFSFSFPFTEEFARIGIIWVCYLLLPVCLKEGRHATVTLLIDRLNPRVKHVLYYIIQAISLTFYIIAFLYSFKNIALNSSYLSPSMRLPGPWIYSSVTTGLVLAILQIFVEIIGVTCGNLAPFYNVISDDPEMRGEK
jgi:TRAP-type C4-dicarboxylate transport system permease small subunit